MPLINLKTKLKDLKFEGKAPYVRKDINNPGTPAANQIQARLDDVQRLAGIFTDKPGGIFTAKQALLQSSQIRTLSDLTLGKTIIPVAARLTSLLAQIPVNGTGTHFSAVEFGGFNSTYVRNNAASGEALYGGRISTRRNSQYLNPGFKYDQILKANGNLSYSSQIGETPAATSAKAKGDIQINKFNPKRENRDIYGLSAQVQGGESLESKYGFSNKSNPDAVNLLDIGQDGDDLVPLKVSVIGQDDSLVVFRGFYQSINDTYNGTWNEANYVGRAESLYTYSKFSRNLNFSFKVPIFSDLEQDKVYNKVNTFLSYTAPTYSENGFPKGTILKLQIGEFINVNGVINSIGMSVAQDVPWSEGISRRLLPQVIDLTVTFSAIHSFIPQLVTIPVKPYIAPGGIVPQGFTNVPLRNTDTPTGQILRQFNFGQELGQAGTSFLQRLLNTTFPNLRPPNNTGVVNTGNGNTP